jgi:glycosyltransferase involved in cell wall biosynthesis
MKISVIMPCYNCGRWIGDALRSIAAQTYPAHEIIVIDDGSTDDSMEKVRTSGVEVRLLRTERLNAAAARNAGIEAATGNWVAFLDADNLWRSHHLEQAATLLRASGDSLYVCHPEPASGGVRQVPVETPQGGLTSREFIAWRLAGSWGFPTTGLVGRINEIRAESGFDSSQVRRHDIDLVIRLISQRSWSFHPNPSWWSRPPRKGDISADDVSCRFYLLRSLIRNAPRFTDPGYTQLLRREAMKAMRTAVIAGTDNDRERVLAIAGGAVGPVRRFGLMLAHRWPKAGKRILGAKHRSRTSDGLAA